MSGERMDYSINGNKIAAAAVAASLQLCPTLWDLIDCIALQAPLSTGILQARILEWVAMASSRGSSQPRDRTQVSHIAGGFFTIWATREARKTVSWFHFFLKCPEILYTYRHDWGEILGRSISDFLDRSIYIFDRCCKTVLLGLVVFDRESKSFLRSGDQQVSWDIKHEMEPKGLTAGVHSCVSS